MNGVFARGLSKMKISGVSTGDPASRCVKVQKGTNYKRTLELEIDEDIRQTKERSVKNHRAPGEHPTNRHSSPVSVDRRRKPKSFQGARDIVQQERDEREGEIKLSTVYSCIERYRQTNQLGDCDNNYVE